jgi:hypothetical protein
MFGLLMQSANCSTEDGMSRQLFDQQQGERKINKRSIYGAYKHLPGYNFMPKKSYGMWYRLPGYSNEQMNPGSDRNVNPF